MNYYSENDPHAAAWLRELIAAGEIPEGRVDERSIVDVQPSDLNGYDQHHFFAGIAGWPLALRLAGVAPERRIFSGSAPCQPYSSAGKQKGHADERDLWPAWFRLIRQCCPDCILGEQVANAIGHGWLDRVCDDLEGEGYAVGAIVLGAFSVGAPHIRQRLYWVAHADQGGRQQHPEQHCEQVLRAADGDSRRGYTDGCGDSGGLAHADGIAGREGCEVKRGRHSGSCEESRTGPVGSSHLGRLADTISGGRDGWAPDEGREQEGRAAAARRGEDGRMGHPDDDERPQGRGLRPDGGAGIGATWTDGAAFIPCADGKSRRIKSGLAPLVAGLPRGVVHSRDSGVPIHPEATGEARVMRLRGYGNAICPPLAAEFIRAALNL